MEKYNHKKIEKKWQERWEKDGLYKAEDNSSKKKFYALVEFPYPSGDGLHVGHVRPYVALDVVARKKRAEGFNVLYPMGWDAFGLPTENYAIKTGVHPKIATKENTDKFRRQIKSIGLSFDWSREINTTDPKYYKWTQWIFLQLYKHGLAYKANIAINWCLSCKTGLANEEVIEEECERCGGKTEKRQKEQWMLSITKYADRLDEDLDTVDYLEPIKIQQRNWIGSSEGAEIKFPILNSQFSIDIFTTRPDTLFGATYMVLAPEHKLVAELLANKESGIKNHEEVNEYIEKTKKKTEIERTAEGKEKTGVELKGIKAINPANKKEIPVFIADYVMVEYGTGAIMAVPAHDDRDFEFAKKFNLLIHPVIMQSDQEIHKPLLGVSEKVPDKGHKDYKFVISAISKSLAEYPTIQLGVLINSGKFDGMESEKAKKKITEFVKGETKVTYKLRDWIFSRQRYWGEPIPMINCKECGWVPVPEDELPVELPEVKDYKPTDSGESPLANSEKWVNVKCPSCKGQGVRETDTMPNWAGSSWYYLRYTDPHNDKALADKKNLKYWTPVDWYNGGMEHTTLHLLYSRFWHKFLYDIKVVPTSEPYQKRTSHGIILAESGEKMSKSKGNVINPDDVIENVGADTLRVYEMFMGPFDQTIAWNTDNMIGGRRFLEKIWKMQVKVVESKKLKVKSKIDSLLHKTVKKVEEDTENMKFNTAVSSLMIFVNAIEREKEISKENFEIFLILLAPFAPHIAEELWEKLGEKSSILKEKWPKYDPSKTIEDKARIAVQINGKVRATIDISTDENEENVKEKALANENVKKWIGEKKIKKVVYIKGRILSIVT